MNNTTKKNVGFEVFESDENSVVYKRVLPDKGRTKKELIKHELDQPRATMHLFDQNDIQKLKEIEKELIKQINVEKNSRNWYEIFAKVLGVDFKE